MAAILKVYKDGEWIDIPAVKGADGVSPKVDVTDDGEKITIKVTDAEGEKSISYGKGSGDMLKSTYDKNGNGKVDAAENADDADRLGGELPEAYRKKADKIALADVENALAKDWLTGTFPASGWAENGGNWVQTIAADLNPETDDVQIDIDLPTGEGKQEALDAWSNLYDFEMGNQTLTAKWFEKPEVDITVKILRWREVK